MSDRLFSRKILLMAYTEKAGELAAELAGKLEAEGYLCSGYLFDRFQSGSLQPFHHGSEIAGKAFNEESALIFVGACGIAVRLCAPYIRSKQTDPPVIVIDERAQYVIPILSGHLGGANALAEQIARVLSAQAVLTTATDVEKCFAADLFAKQNHLVITDMEKAKAVSAKSLSGSTITILPEDNAAQIYCKNNTSESPAVKICPGGSHPDENGQADIVISRRVQNCRELQLIPKEVIVGIGCKKNTPPESLRRAVRSAFAAHDLDMRAIAAISSIDLKKDETGLKELAENLNVPFLTFPAEVLKSAEGSVSSSAYVELVTGVDNVCERSALTLGDTLLFPKTICEHITVAAASCSSRFILFGGTTEGRELTEYMEQNGIPCLVVTATDYGREVLPRNMRYCRVIAQRMDAGQMKHIFTVIHPEAVIDATHPFAEQVSANIRTAAQETGIRLIRVLRPQDPPAAGVLYYDSAEQAAEFLSAAEGNILLTTGIKDLHTFIKVRNARERIWVRVLHHSVQPALDAGFPREHIIAAQGPFGTGENIRTLQEIHARYLVSKDSGALGGVPQKIEAARQCGCIPLILRRPAQDTGISVRECEAIIRHGAGPDAVYAKANE